MLFHGQTHINLWRATPLRSLNPHLVLAVVVAAVSILAFFVYQCWKEAQRERQELEQKENAEQMLVRLIRRRQIIEGKIEALQKEHQENPLGEQELRDKLKTYRSQLAKIKYKPENLEEDWDV